RATSVSRSSRDALFLFLARRSSRDALFLFLARARGPGWKKDTCSAALILTGATLLDRTANKTCPGTERLRSIRIAQDSQEDRCRSIRATSSSLEPAPYNTTSPSVRCSPSAVSGTSCRNSRRRRTSSAFRIGFSVFWLFIG